MPRLARSVMDSSVMSSPENPAAGGLIQAHNGLGQGGLTAAVGAGYNQKGSILYLQGDVLQNFLFSFLSVYGKGKVLQF